MTVYGSTQVYLIPVTGGLREAQAACRVWELRGFEVLSVSSSAALDFIITARASATLYVNFMKNDQLYQAGPYDGQEEAKRAELAIMQHYEIGEAKGDVYTTAQRDHDRTYMGIIND